MRYPKYFVIVSMMLFNLSNNQLLQPSIRDLFNRFENNKIAETQDKNDNVVSLDPRTKFGINDNSDGLSNIQAEDINSKSSQNRLTDSNIKLNTTQACLK